MVAIAESHSVRNTQVQMISPLLIHPWRHNPRKTFAEDGIAELADSIREHGVIEPIIVRPIPLCTGYTIVAGERRWRASQLAGLHHMPCIVRGDLEDDAAALRLALVENLQRRDLDPIEEAEGYRQLNQVVGLKQAEIAAAVNRTQPAIANRMRLLDLPDDVRERIRAGEISPAHGVALAKFKGYPGIASKLAETAVERRLTSKDLEGDSLPWPYDLGTVNLVRSLSSWNTRFDRAACEKCEHRRLARGSDPYCLNPACFDEKERAAAAAKSQKVAEVKAEAESRGQQLATLRELGSEEVNYKTIRRWTTLPVGCRGEDCDRRRKALDGTEIVEVCADPKCWRKLGAAATRNEKKTKRQDLTDLSARIRERIAQVAEIGPRELAVLLVYAAGSAQGDALDVALANRKDVLPSIPKGQPMLDGKKWADAYEAAPTTEIALAVLEALMQTEIEHGRRELEGQSTYGSTSHHLAEWYLDGDGGAVLPEGGL